MKKPSSDREVDRKVLVVVATSKGCIMRWSRDALVVRSIRKVDGPTRAALVVVAIFSTSATDYNEESLHVGVAKDKKINVKSEPRKIRMLVWGRKFQRLKQVHL